MASFEKLASKDAPKEPNMERRRRELAEMGTGEKQKKKAESEMEYQRRTRGKKDEE